MGSTVIRPGGRPEWLELRKRGIGSSEVATIVGLNPWETRYQLWRRKVGLDGGKPESFAMKAGHYLEEAVSRFWSDETGREVIKRSAGDWLIRDDDLPFLQVSPDRTYWLAGERRSAGNKGILECKTTQMPVDADDIPKHWFCQVQYQLGVAGLEHGSLAWLCCGREFGWRDIDLVPDFYGWLVQEVERFWRDNVVGGVEPPIVGVADWALKYDRHVDGKSVEVGEDVAEAVARLKDVNLRIKGLEAEKSGLEATVKTAFGDAETITRQGVALATCRASKPSAAFDSKRFAAEHPEEASRYMVERKGARRLLLK